MLLTNQHPLNKAIMVSVLGKPNAGKSTFINAMLGQELSIVSPLPQTTRNHFHCAMTVDRTEIVLVDTPGIHQSNKELNLRMNQEAEFSLEASDMALLLVESHMLERQNFDLLAEMLKLRMDVALPVWMVFTKKDLAQEKINLNHLQSFVKHWKSRLPNLQDQFFWISATTEENIHQVTALILDKAQSGPHLYPKGDLSNKNMRFFVAEFIREQVYYLFKDELPYEIAVSIDSFKELEDSPKNLVAEISASILVNRPSQRAIVIGSAGKMIREIGTRSRQKIEELLGGKVFLNLHVKVMPKWFNNNFVLESLGLPRAKNSHRVWRSHE